MQIGDISALKGLDDHVRTDHTDHLADARMFLSPSFFTGKGHGRGRRRRRRRRRKRSRTQGWIDAGDLIISLLNFLLCSLFRHMLSFFFAVPNGCIRLRTVSRTRTGTCTRLSVVFGLSCKLPEIERHTQHGKDDLS